MLHELLADMKRWKEGLPDHLKFRGAETSQNAGKGCQFFHPTFQEKLGFIFFQVFFTSSLRVFQ